MKSPRQKLLVLVIGTAGRKYFGILYLALYFYTYAALIL